MYTHSLSRFARRKLSSTVTCNSKSAFDDGPSPFTLFTTLTPSAVTRDAIMRRAIAVPMSSSSSSAIFDARLNAHRGALTVSRGFIVEALLCLREVKRRQHPDALLRQIRGDAVYRAGRERAEFTEDVVLQRRERPRGVLKCVARDFDPLGRGPVRGDPGLAPRRAEVEEHRGFLEVHVSERRGLVRLKPVAPRERDEHVPVLTADREPRLDDAQGAVVRQKRFSSSLVARFVVRDDGSTQVGQRGKIRLSVFRFLRRERAAYVRRDRRDQIHGLALQVVSEGR
eukprot:30497-Pelagococcus_subviridis.AAC.13